MFTVYVYVLDTLADWELGYVTAELSSKRFFRKGAPEVSVKTVAISKEPIKTMGGLTGEIGEALGLSRSAVQRRRTKSLKVLRTKLTARKGGYCNCLKTVPIR